MTSIDIAAVIGGDTLFSRAEGERVREHILALATADGGDLQLDFQGIRILGFSAAYEAFERTLKIMRRRDWKARVLAINLNAQVAENLDASLHVVGLAGQRVHADGATTQVREGQQ